MARKPNYDFERREREKARAAKTEERATAKAERKREAVMAEPGASAPDQDNADQIASGIVPPASAGPPPRS